MAKDLPSKVGHCYQHDCADCVSLGVWVMVGEGMYFDLYACLSGVIPTLRVRYGDEPDQAYGSLAEAYDQERRGLDTPLVEALKLARTKGLIRGKT